jgi:hypothetical protein
LRVAASMYAVAGLTRALVPTTSMVSIVFDESEGLIHTRKELSNACGIDSMNHTIPGRKRASQFEAGQCGMPPRWSGLVDS